MDKQHLRFIMKEKRKEMFSVIKEALENEIFLSLKESDIIKNNDSFFVYNSLKDEVSTRKLIAYLLKINKKVYLPKINGSFMIAVKYEGQALKQGAFNVYEPDGEEYKGKIDVSIIPLLAVDKNGNRVGYGGGYYDKFLENNKCLKVGLCFSFQTVEKIEKDINDVALDYVVSDLGILKII